MDLDMFYNEFLKEAATGKINCASLKYIYFDTLVEGDLISGEFFGDEEFIIKPTLVINNKKEFDELLVQYVELVKAFHKDEINLDHFAREELEYIDKAILSFLFLNLSLEDFENPCDYLRRRIDFFLNCPSDKPFEVVIPNLLNSTVKFEINKDIMIMETPYVLDITVTNDDSETYHFPSISFGISDGTVEFYTMQTKNYDEDPTFNKNKFSKKLNRTFYKIGENYDLDKNSHLTNVTASFVVAANLALAYFKRLGYDSFSVNSFLLTRWNEKRIKYNNPPYPELCPIEIADSFKKKQLHIQYNLTEKFISTFLRVLYYYDDCFITNMPFLNYNTFLDFTLGDNNTISNSYLSEQFNTICPYSVKKKTI